VDRQAHWQQVYTDKAPDQVIWYQSEPTLSLELIAAAGLPPRAAVLDVGGGASRLAGRLLDWGYRPAVLDIAAALEQTRRGLGGRADQVAWFEFDITTFHPPHRFDLWHDRAVFHFPTDPADRAAYLATLARTLNPGGQVVMGAFALDGPTKCSGLEIVQYDAPKLLATLGERFERLEERREEHTTPGGGIQNFGFYRLRWLGA